MSDNAGNSALTAAQAAATIDTDGKATVSAFVNGTFVGTLIPEATIDGSNWFAVDAFVANGDAPVQAITAGGQWIIPCGAFDQVRLRCSAYTSGTINVALRASDVQQVLAPTRQNITIAATAARTLAFTGDDIPTGGASAFILDFDETAHASSPSNTPTIQGKDPVSGVYYTLLAGAAITTEGHTTMAVGRGLPVTSNVSANAPLPAVIRVVVAVANANSMTYSLGGTLVP